MSYNSLLGEAERKLKGAGLNVEMHVSPGIGHTVGPDGQAADGAFARHALAKPRYAATVPEMTAEGEWSADEHPVTPEGRYYAVRGHLWRNFNPGL